MSGVTYEGFVEFVKSQPRETEVHHTGSLYEGWCGCFVGDYYRSLGLDISPFDLDAGDFIELENVKLYKELSQQDIANDLYPTYGDLADAL